MSYKVGDKIKIKTWGEMEKEFGLHPDGYIYDLKSGHYFKKNREEYLQEHVPDRTMTIKSVSYFGGSYLTLLGGGFYWFEIMIKK